MGVEQSIKAMRADHSLPAQNASPDNQTTVAASVPQQPPLVSRGLFDGAAVVSDPYWPQLPSGAFREWVEFASYPNYLVAHIVAGRLEVEGVPTLIDCVGILPDGTNPATIWVVKQLAHRARFVVAWPEPTDEELTLLATGELLVKGSQE